MPRPRYEEPQEEEEEEWDQAPPPRKRTGRPVRRDTGGGDEDEPEAPPPRKGTKKLPPPPPEPEPEEEDEEDEEEEEEEVRTGVAGQAATRPCTCSCLSQPPHPTTHPRRCAVAEAKRLGQVVPRPEPGRQDDCHVRALRCVGPTSAAPLESACAPSADCRAATHTG